MTNTYDQIYADVPEPHVLEQTRAVLGVVDGTWGSWPPAATSFDINGFVRFRTLFESLLAVGIAVYVLSLRTKLAV